jgi:hypothetical protein
MRFHFSSHRALVFPKSSGNRAASAALHAGDSRPTLGTSAEEPILQTGQGIQKSSLG